MKAKKLAEGAGEGMGSAPQRAECARRAPEAWHSVVGSVFSAVTLGGMDRKC